MINEIDQVRESLEAAFDSARIIADEHIFDISPCGRYRLDVDSYATADCPNYSSISVGSIRAVATGDMIACIKRNDDRWFHGWVLRDNGDYLVCSEDLEGQTVVDLRQGKVAGFSSKEDPFIWCEFYPSPDSQRIVIFGCYWACPYMLIVYDFSNPMSLPLPNIAEYVLKRNDSRFGEWLDNDRISLLHNDESVAILNILDLATLGVP